MLDKLPQSILAKAFRGELVPQNPDEEPANKLLERIKKEKEKNKRSQRIKEESNSKVVLFKNFLHLLSQCKNANIPI